MNKDDKKKIYSCSNCGFSGHTFKNCNEPITSWGIILVKTNMSIKNCNYFDIKKTVRDGVKIKGMRDIINFQKYINMIKFLLIRRKHSLGYIEFMRGRYFVDNFEGIIYLFQQMTPEEINKLSKFNFDELWEDLWNKDTKRITHNKKEYLESKEKFEILKNKTNVDLSIDFYIKNVKPFYDTPEWGFPKGRKAKNECDLECALREFYEETGYTKDDINILENVKPIIENITGTNGVSYRHVYYLAEITDDIKFNIENNSEVGDIGFFNYSDANYMIRDYHIEKKDIMNNIFTYYVNMYLESRDKNSDEDEDGSE